MDGFQIIIKGKIMPHEACQGIALYMVCFVQHQKARITEGSYHDTHGADHAFVPGLATEA
jgi:hypothetical protein